jgi:hypothetical protein
MRLSKPARRAEHGLLAGGGEIFGWPAIQNSRKQAVASLGGRHDREIVYHVVVASSNSIEQFNRGVYHNQCLLRRFCMPATVVGDLRLR